MPHRQRRQIKIFSLVNSKLFLIMAIFLLVVLFVVLGKEIWHTYQVNQEIQNLEVEVAELEGKNQELSELLTYLDSDDYKESEAREKLFLKQPGENVVATLPGQGAGDANSDQGSNIVYTDEEIKTIPDTWWDYFFAVN